MNIAFAAKKIGPQWEAATIVNGTFARALVGDSLPKIIDDLLGQVLRQERPAGEVVINLTFVEPTNEDHTAGLARIPNRIEAAR